MLKPAEMVTPTLAGQVLVADREADIYSSLATVPDTNFHMLGQAMIACWLAEARCARRRNVSRSGDN